MSAPGNTDPAVMQPQSQESALLFQRQKTNGPHHFQAAGGTARLHWSHLSCFCSLFIRYLKTFLQEKEASGLRNDSLLNMVQLHRTMCRHARLQLKPEGKSERRDTQVGAATPLQEKLAAWSQSAAHRVGVPSSQPLSPDDQEGVARAGGEGPLSESGLGLLCRRDDAHYPTLRTLRPGEQPWA